jgi:hypothetical protein
MAELEAGLEEIRRAKGRGVLVDRPAAAEGEREVLEFRRA